MIHVISSFLAKIPIAVALWDSYMIHVISSFLAKIPITAALNHLRICP
jgi:hypothetical protein